MAGDGCSRWCGYCGRCTDGDGRQGKPKEDIQTEADFKAALRRAEQDSIAMRARWARQDAAKKQGAA